VYASHAAASYLHFLPHTLYQYMFYCVNVLYVYIYHYNEPLPTMATCSTFQC